MDFGICVQRNAQDQVPFPTLAELFRNKRAEGKAVCVCAGISTQ